MMLRRPFPLTVICILTAVAISCQDDVPVSAVNDASTASGNQSGQGGTPSGGGTGGVAGGVGNVSGQAGAGGGAAGSSNGGNAGNGGTATGGVGGVGGVGSGGNAGSAGNAGKGGNAGAGGNVSGACLSRDCQGTCLGRGCGGVWTCDTSNLMCTDDLAGYCGCDGKTFRGSGSCPQRAFLHRRTCEQGAICDQTLIRCRALSPDCPAGQVPEVWNGCWGGCVPIDSCACDEPGDCPNSNQYTCHMGKGRCGPYVQ